MKFKIDGEIFFYRLQIASQRNGRGRRHLDVAEVVGHQLGDVEAEVQPLRRHNGDGARGQRDPSPMGVYGPRVGGESTKFTSPLP